MTAGQNAQKAKQTPSPQGSASRSPRREGFPAALLIDTCKFHLRTVEEARLLSAFAASLFPDPGRVEPGLYELLVNAVEHGCLGIGHDLKTRLIENRSLNTEIARRQSLPENRQRKADLVIARRPEGMFAIITDPGSGFDWQNWLQLDPARARASHGRGIAKARNISFDTLVYNAAGNQVAGQIKGVQL